MKNAVKVGQRYRVECHDRHGNLKWVEEFDNLVVTAGRNKYLDATLKTGLAAPAWYVGLKDTGTPDPADTMASHASWATITPTPTPQTRPLPRAPSPAARWTTKGAKRCSTSMRRMTFMALL